MRTWFQILLVAFGSAAGGLTRWGIGIYATRWLGTSFPWATFLINVSGCLFLGWFSIVITERVEFAKLPWITREELKLMLAVGFTGAYTTFSTFELETFSLFRDGSSWKAIAYLISSLIAGLLAVRLGVLLAGGR
ncbi:fluoride efflux transporter CrcB [Schlesneria paludicola]|uniref:fluoride efflux transporter CrcB n=1 Tax=Schlesneria paludicola TaxID=360056 RepID=UPI00029A7F55|nr:fluoride efflux transporter CrcB [Schlesneria paludicola]